jgi:hypothetical protein
VTANANRVVLFMTAPSLWLNFVSYFTKTYVND